MNVVDVLPRDAIPSVDEPSFEPVAAYEGRPDDEVVRLTLDGETRLYPIRYLNYHEIVNDTLGGVPVAATWCPLCGSVVAFDRRVAGRTLTFGVSGKLADDTLVMYDRETESDWKQSLGRAIGGELDEERLTRLPVAVSSYESARADHPEASILARPRVTETAAEPTADTPAYDEDPYDDYFAGDGFGLAARRDDGSGRTFPLGWLDAKTVVVGVERGGETFGFPRPVVEQAGGVVTATVGEESVVVVAVDGLHVYRNTGGEWVLDGEELQNDGRVYDATSGEVVDGGGDGLRRVPSVRLFAFGWYDNHGPDAFYEG